MFESQGLFTRKVRLSPVGTWFINGLQLVQFWFCLRYTLRAFAARLLPELTGFRVKNTKYLKNKTRPNIKDVIEEKKQKNLSVNRLYAPTVVIWCHRDCFFFQVFFCCNAVPLEMCHQHSRKSVVWLAEGDTWWRGLKKIMYLYFTSVQIWMRFREFPRAVKMQGRKNLNAHFLHGFIQFYLCFPVCLYCVLCGPVGSTWASRIACWGRRPSRDCVCASSSRRRWPTATGAGPVCGTKSKPSARDTSRECPSLAINKTYCINKAIWIVAMINDLIRETLKFHFTPLKAQLKVKS